MPAAAIRQKGVGIVEVMVSVVIGMLLVLMMFQTYLVTEGQKRTVTSGSDAQQNAAYGIFLLSQDLSMAGNVIAASATALSGCTMALPIPVTIAAGATDNDPDTITVFYGGGGSIENPVPLLANATMSASSPATFQVSGPVAFSPNDTIIAVQGANCTMSTINAAGVSVAAATGIATISHTLTATTGNNTTATYNAVSASLVNLGQPDRYAQIRYAVNTATSTLTTQSLLPTAQAAAPVVAQVVNMKALYGLDTDGDGNVDTWQTATGNWSSANLPAQPLATWQQVRVVRVALVARSTQYESTNVTPGPIGIFCTPAPCAFSMTLTADQQHYRYKVLETTVPLRNAVWNAS